MTARLAYIVSRFPILSETFILRELLTLEELGWPIDLFAIQHSRQAVRHPEAIALESRVRYAAPIAGRTLRASSRLLPHHRGVCARLFAQTVAGYASSPEFLAKALVVLPAAVEWADHMRAARVEHIHAHFGSFPALAALVASEILGIGFSFTVHAHDLFADNLMLAQKVLRARFVATISDYNRQRLRALAGSAADRVVVVRCGVDVASYQPATRAGRRDTRLILAVAALREYKGLEHLVRACALIRESAPEERFVCHIVGDGPMRRPLEQLIRRLGLDRHVHLLGARDQHAVRETLPRADTFVLPSVVASNGYMDGIPVALMEAMASRVPVVASALSGIPELVRPDVTGLLVPPGDAGAIRDAVLECWRSPAAAQQRAARGRALVEREYDLRSNARQLAALFDSVLAARSAAAGAQAVVTSNLAESNP